MTTKHNTLGTLMINDKTTNSWNEWSRFILEELKRLNECSIKLELKMDNGLQNVEVKAEEHKKELLVEIEKLRFAMETEKIDLAVFKVKAGLWGALSGAIASVLAILIYLLEFSKG
jgi:hypothetical protein